MGGSLYNHEARVLRSELSFSKSKSDRAIFTSTSINSKMNPYGVTLRESRDTEGMPPAFPIIIALDVTGSMGSIPSFLIRQGLPKIMKTIMDAGVENPQVLFCAVGDHECDESPFQVGQFESNDELLDYWLQNVYLEGGGGPNYGESYSLAHYFAAFRTAHDHMDKRGLKGVLITIGDEPNLPEYPSSSLNQIFGPKTDNEIGHQGPWKDKELSMEATKLYDVYHIHMSGRRWDSDSVASIWSQKIGPTRVKDAVNPEQVASRICECIMQTVNSQKKSDIKTSVSEAVPSDNPEVHTIL